MSVEDIKALQREMNLRRSALLEDIFNNPSRKYIHIEKKPGIIRKLKRMLQAWLNEEEDEEEES